MGEGMKVVEDLKSGVLTDAEASVMTMVTGDFLERIGSTSTLGSLVLYMV